jgi:uncharacterized OB-fold protein
LSTTDPTASPETQQVPGPARPLPEPDPLTVEFWEAARRHELMAQRCGDCGGWMFPPLAGCAECASSNVHWEKVSGQGTIFSWIVVHATPHPYWREQAPYTVVEVLLDEQATLRMKGTMPGYDSDNLEVGMRVQVAFEDVTDSVALPYWTAAQA